MRTVLFLLLIGLSAGFVAVGADKTPTEKDPTRVFPPGKFPADVRLKSARSYGTAYHPWTPPKTLDEWKKERQRIRRQVLVSQGLWPLPPKTPLKAVIHGKIDRGEYTIEKVFFQSYPGHYVTGNLYRPKKISDKAPGVLCPHGHWRNGRFYDAGEARAKQQMAKGAESFFSAARYPLQARMVGLVRMGCVVFHYDMVGYADSTQIKHRQGFTDAEAGLRLQNFMGLQTWNSIRALDFLTSLPEVDPARIGVTGASGGGTQTFMLCAVDDRPAVAFPAVMVSTAMQGGCICENASYLRIGINNIALAALFAPKPLAMSGADDWTIAIETKGLPELRQIYSLYGKPENVSAKAFPQFKHNYNQVAREMMYEWFNRHLQLGQKSPIKERDFRPVPPRELSVWDAQHPRPQDGGAVALRKYLTGVSEQQFARLIPKNPKKKADVDTYRKIIGGAAHVMFGEVPELKDLRLNPDDQRPVKLDEATFMVKGFLKRRRSTEIVPTMALLPAVLVREDGKIKAPPKKAVFWFTSAGKVHLLTGKGVPTPAVRKLLDQKISVASLDVFLTGEFLSSGASFPKVHSTYAGYTFGYNRPLIANRVRDIVTALGPIPAKKNLPAVLVGTGKAGPWVLLAAGLLGDKVDKVIVDLNGFSFRKIRSTSDPNFLPGALKYGGIGGLGALAAPTELVLYGTKNIPAEELAPLIQMYAVTGGKLTLHAGPLSDEQVVQEVLRK